jgi:hypothetical protein
VWLVLKFDLFEDGLKLLQDCHTERQSLTLSAEVPLTDTVLLIVDLLIFCPILKLILCVANSHLAHGMLYSS